MAMAFIGPGEESLGWRRRRGRRRRKGRRGEEVEEWKEQKIIIIFMEI